ncbi:hypothetical protein VTP01DRAFT_7406 [Rhizomucor pusillus]|uniref:uncharacterized protein n=1 Tax=Rhizomucor pusillus TaxID=4840 RepID=UPI0037448DF8
MVHADIGPEKLRPRIAETFNPPSSTSNMKAVRANIEEFDTKIAEAVSRSNNVYVVFFGTEVPETSESWCPDCVIADPLIRKALLNEAPEDAILVEAPVGDRNAWKGNASHPYRVRFNVPAIPTLVKWSKDGPVKQLVENDCADYENLKSFILA